MEQKKLFGIFDLNTNGEIVLHVGGFPGSTFANETGQVFPVDKPNNKQ